MANNDAKRSIHPPIKVVFVLNVKKKKTKLNPDKIKYIQQRIVLVTFELESFIKSEGYVDKKDILSWIILYPKYIKIINPSNATVEEMTIPC